jgi:DNA replication protein DnaC
VDRRLKTLLRNAKLKKNACIEDIDYKSSRGINKSLILNLSGCDWIKNAQNIIITGSTGVGKTYLAYTLANSVWRKGFFYCIKDHPACSRKLLLPGRMELIQS